ncbi:unnamed protein product [Haemonchus placei]|uniref:ShKT domain-containing protein n=1 Tax=Haemonchus placei TaxID=6290 RepID=A0A0N4WPX0_HAEPC|nr:unnamed protein product [Haemonchus placei]
MWFYYFICLSLMLNINDGMASKIKTLLGKLGTLMGSGNLERCKDQSHEDCQDAKATGLCQDQAWKDQIKQFCPKTCGFCEK